MKIFLDSNVYFNNYFFESAPFRYLSHFINNLGYELLVPRVVAQEVENNRRKAVDKMCVEADSLVRQLRNLTRMEITFPVHSELPEYDFLYELKRRFDGVRVLEYAAISHADVVQRAMTNTRPFRGGEKGYRDTLIWLSILDHLKATTETTQFVFINDNYTDFFKSESDPSFHDDFKPDLGLIPSNVAIKTYRGLAGFVKESVDPEDHAIDINNAADRFEKFLEREALAYMSTSTFKAGRHLGRLLNAGTAEAIIDAVALNIGVDHGMEDFYLGSVSKINDDEVYITCTHDLRGVDFDIAIARSLYAAHQPAIEDEPHVVDMAYLSEVAVRLKIFAQIDFSVSFVYNHKANKCSGYSTSSIIFVR